MNRPLDPVQCKNSLFFLFGRHRDQYGFQKATQWITLETCHEFERFYQPILDRRRARWQQLLDEHNGSLLDRCLQVRRYIRKGVPYQLRGQVWLHYSGAQSKMDANPGVYDKFLKRAQELGDTNEFADLIERDLHRTYPDNIQFSQTALAKTSGAASTTSPATPSPAKSANTTTTTTPPAIDVLRRVLCTFSVYCPSIGYCQSLNYLVGMLLLFMKEEEAFWCLVTTVHNILPAGVYDVTMEGTSIDQTVLMMLVHERMPQFWNKLTPKSFWEAEQDGVSMPTITLVTSHWFLTLFINILPTESVLRVWDCFF
ncbi:rab-GTPase-TBC domain-containing protein [Gongronella butleri]|nr:rab-GTPase-TBC domain-containing protein [Gongronella butleri]